MNYPYWMPLKPGGGGGGGTQPELFPPVVVGGYNSIAWSTDTRNGSFPVITTGKIDGVEYTSPLTITQAMQDKHLIIESVADNFQSASTDILLYYMSAQSSLLAISDGEDTAQYGLAFEVSDTSLIMPQGYASTSGNKYYSSKLTTDSSGAASSSIAFSLACLSSTHPATLKVSVVDGQNNVVKGNIAFTITKNGTSVYTASVSGGDAELSIPSSIAWETGDDIEVIVNATIISFVAPSKGDLITMNVDGTNKQFRVLNVNGNNAEVVAMFSPNNSQIFASSGNTYAGLELDTYLNSTWYNTLNATAQAAIVDKTFTQDSWYYGDSGDPDYSGYNGPTKPGTNAYTISLGSATFGAEITRHVYALSVQDVLDYVLDTSVGDGLLQNYNIWKMFWNDELQHTDATSYLWLRSANASSSAGAFIVYGSSGYVNNYGAYNTRAVRPAFTIDLSKITFTIVS